MLPVVCLLGIFLSGCGQLDLDTGQVAATIKTDIINKIGAGVTAVKCPHRVAAVSGRSFNCTVQGLDGSKIAVNVRQSGAAGRIVYTVPKLINIGKLEQQLASLSDGLRSFSCPALVQDRAGISFTCSAKKGNSQKKLVRAKIRLDKDDHLAISWGQDK